MILVVADFLLVRNDEVRRLISTGMDEIGAERFLISRRMEEIVPSKRCDTCVCVFACVCVGVCVCVCALRRRDPTPDRRTGVTCCITSRYRLLLYYFNICFFNNTPLPKAGGFLGRDFGPGKALPYGGILTVPECGSEQSSSGYRESIDFAWVERETGCFVAKRVRKSGNSSPVTSSLLAFG